MQLAVRVVPNAKKPRLQIAGDSLKVWIDAPAQNGKANKRLVEILAQKIGARKSDIRIIRGKKSRDKLIEIPDHAAKCLFDQTS